MKIFAFSDLHGHIEFLEKYKKYFEKADIILFAGDFFPYKSTKEEVLNTAEKINETFKNKQFLFVWGNVDFVEATRHNFTLNQLITVGENINLKNKTINNVSFVGFDYFEFDTDLRIPENIFPADVFLSHLPPKNTKLDKTFLNTHIGSQLLKELVLEKKPKIWICGHVHESKGKIKIGNTNVYNIGPAKDDNFLLIEL